MSVSPGHISATVVMNGGRPRASVRTVHPPPVARALIGQPAAKVPSLAGRLFALCGKAHTAAAALALEQAGGPGSGNIADMALSVLRERVAGGLRDFTLAFAGGGMTGQDATMLRSLHGSLSLAQFTATATDLLKRCRHWAEALRPACAGGPPAVAPDCLRPADDPHVAAALAAAPLAFAASPALNGRCPETGPYARHATLQSEGEMAARLDARLASLDEAVAALNAPGLANLAAAGPLGRREGWAAVEIGRGRLYHVVALDAAGRVAAYGMVSPTDWNFRPGGPFEKSLGRLAPEGRQETERRARLLLNLFDPCMACHLDVRESPHA